jgi:hypothetical protein
MWYSSLDEKAEGRNATHMRADGIFYWSYDGSLIIYKIIFCLNWCNYHAHFNQVTADCSEEINWKWSKLRISLALILSPHTLTRTLWTSETTFPVISSISSSIKWHFWQILLRILWLFRQLKRVLCLWLTCNLYGTLRSNHWLHVINVIWEQNAHSEKSKILKCSFG